MIIFLLLAFVYGYKPLSYSEITSKLTDLSQKCPFFKIYTAQERYDIPYPIDCNNCSHMIGVISNSNNVSAPQVYFSGCLHGDERVGPVVVAELADYLCTEYDRNPWIKRLVDTRLIIITPMTNAQGYYNNQREEIIDGTLVDPNRDFPYDNAYRCFQSLTSQVIGKIFEEHLVRISITFHAGDTSITYPWGSYNHLVDHKSTEAPDLAALASIASSVLSYSGAGLRTGAMSDIVYPVYGGLEDWAYGGGWDTSGASNCSDIQFNNSEGLKQIMYLVETTGDKSPADYAYGNKEDVPSGGGYVPEYIRMALSIIDFAEPYIDYNIKYLKEGILVEWKLWGCIKVKETKIYYSKLKDSWPTWNHTLPLSGGCRWGENTVFSEIFEHGEMNLVITAEVDEWTSQINPDPNVRPQSHIVKARSTTNYHIYHNSFEIIGDPIIKTDLIQLFRKPIRVLVSTFKSYQVVINAYPDYFEIFSPYATDLYVSEYGDLNYPSQVSPMLEYLCGVNFQPINGKYYNCSDTSNLVGRLITRDYDLGETAIMQSDPINLPNKGGICINESTIINFNPVAPKIVLISVASNSDWILIEFNDQAKTLNLTNNYGSGYWTLGYTSVLGGVIQFTTEFDTRTCVVGVAVNDYVAFGYINIEFPVWILGIAIAAKVCVLSFFIIRRCQKKYSLDKVEYEEIELVFA